MIGSGAGEDDFVKPAVEGTEKVINAVLKNASTVKNFVQTSSMAAVCGAPGSKPDTYVFSDKDWSDVDS
jgi:nucleoside-diphosphate-sugar epimerase